MASILIVEDEQKMRRLLELHLTDEGFTTFASGDAEAGLKILSREKVDLVVTDLRLPGMTGLEFLQAVKRTNAALPVVMMTAYGTVETAVEAMKAGASDYVLKPFSLDEMCMVIRKELDAHNLREENRTLREALGQRYELRQHRRPQRSKCRRCWPWLSAWRPRIPPCCWAARAAWART